MILTEPRELRWAKQREFRFHSLGHTGLERWAAWWAEYGSGW